VSYRATLETIGPIAPNLWEVREQQLSMKKLPYYSGHGRSRLEATMKAIAELRDDFRESKQPGAQDLAQQALDQLKGQSSKPEQFEAPYGTGVAMYAVITVVTQQ